MLGDFLSLDNLAHTKRNPEISSPESGERQEQEKTTFSLFMHAAIFDCIISILCHFLSFLQILLIQDEDSLSLSRSLAGSDT